MVGKKLMIGPALTLHPGWQVVPLDAIRSYGPKKVWLVSKTSADITLSTDCGNEWTLKSGYTLELDMDGAPFFCSRGTELVSNGSFTTTGALMTIRSWTGATAYSAWRYPLQTGVTGKAHHRGMTGGTTDLKQGISVTDGEIYEFKFNLAPATGRTGAVSTITPSMAGVTLAVRSATGTALTECIQAANSTGPIRLTPGSTGAHLYVDEVSVKKITGSQLLFAKGVAGVILQVMFTI